MNGYGTTPLLDTPIPVVRRPDEKSAAGNGVMTFRRTFSALFFVSAWLATLIIFTSVRNEPSLVSSAVSMGSAPHILLVMVDDQGMNDIGYLSTDLSEATPNIDRLAKNGIRLTNYYSMHMCTPARSALMTGLHPMQTGMQHDTLQAISSWGLPVEFELLPARLARNGGYETHALGKWHLGHFRSEYLPTRRGFSTFLGYLTDGESYITRIISKNRPYKDFLDLAEGQAQIRIADPDNLPEANYTFSTDVYAHRLQEILDSKAQENAETAAPLFIYMAFQNVHGPVDWVPDDTLMKFNPTDKQLETIANMEASDWTRGRFSRILVHLDQAMGRIMHTMTETGLLENSIIVYASDNGGCNIAGGSALPFRGRKHTLFEGGLHVPAFISSPMIPKHLQGVEYDNLAHVTDLFPTILDMAGVDYDEEDYYGKSHWAALLGKSTEAPRTELVYNIDKWSSCCKAEGIEYMNATSDICEGEYTCDPIYQFISETVKPNAAIRQGPWKLILNEYNHSYMYPSYDTTVRTADSNECSVPASYEKASFLFNIEDDPYETTNLLDTYPDKAQELHDRISELLKSSEWRDTNWVSVSPEARIAAITTWKANSNYIAPWADAEDFSSR